MKKISKNILFILMILITQEIFAGGGGENNQNDRHNISGNHDSRGYDYLEISEREYNLWINQFQGRNSRQERTRALEQREYYQNCSNNWCNEVGYCEGHIRFYIKVPQASGDRALIDNILYKIFMYIYSMGGYFSALVNRIAFICCALMLGIGAAKVILGAEELRKYLVKSLYTLCLYFILVAVFPELMRLTFDLVGIMAAGAVSTAYDETNNPLSGNRAANTNYNRQIANRRTDADFIKFVNDFGGWYTIENGEVVYKSKDIDIENNILKMDFRTESGLISFDKTFYFIFQTFNIMWKTFTNQESSIWDKLSFLPWIILGFFCCIFYLLAFGKVVIEYFGAVIQHTFLRTVGLIFIPMIIWDASRHTVEKITTSIFNISMKLLVIQIVFYLMLYTNVEILYVCYMWTFQGEIGKTAMRAENYANFIIMAIMIYWVAKGTTSIAEYLSGGNASFGLEEFKMASNAAAGTMAMIAGTAANAAAVARGAGQGMAHAGNVGMGAAKAEYKANQNLQIVKMSEGKGVDVEGGLLSSGGTHLGQGVKAVDKDGNELIVRDSSGNISINKGVRDNFWTDISGNVHAKYVKDSRGNIIKQNDPRSGIKILADNIGDNREKSKQKKLAKRKNWENQATVNEIGNRAFRETLFGRFGRPQDGMVFKILKQGISVGVNNTIDRKRAVNWGNALSGSIDGQNDNFHNSVIMAEKDETHRMIKRSTASENEMDENDKKENTENREGNKKG